MKQTKNQFFKITTVEQALRMGPRRFVRDYLFPAMRREHGNGFAMQDWSFDTTLEDPRGLDGLNDRQAPACHSVMCIGGTMQAILGERQEYVLAAILGIPKFSSDGFDDAETLFYYWTSNRGPWEGLSESFMRASTPQAKERIAEKAVLAAVKSGEKAKGHPKSEDR